MTAPNAVVPDSVNSRQHRSALANAVNQIIKKLWSPNALGSASGSGDQSTSLVSSGGNVLIVGTINVAAAGITFSITRSGTTILTLTNVSPGSTLNFAWIDTPGKGSFTYATSSSGHTNSAAIKATELK